MKKHAQIFKALSDETRLRILLLLQQYGKLCVCDIEAALTIPQSTVSRHLATLRNTGFVEAERRGMWMHYCIQPDQGIRDALLITIDSFCTNQEIATEDAKRLETFLDSKKNATSFFTTTIQSQREQS